MSGLSSIAAASSVDAATDGAWAAPARTGAFEHALDAAQGGDLGVSGVTSSPIDGMLRMFDNLNVEASGLQDAAVRTQDAGDSLTPGEMIMLTMRCDEFMFHCELTSNVASRSSDSLQQLFREQG
jgi:hypothetical protein